MTREALFHIIEQCEKRKIDEKLEFLEKKLVEKTKCPDDKRQLLRDSLKSFKHYFKQKWISASYKAHRFQQNNRQWLEETIALPNWAVPRTGRPRKTFEVCSERSKRRKTEQIRSKIKHEKLIYATHMSTRAAGKADLSRLIKDASSTPTRASKYRKIITSDKKGGSQQTKLSTTKALALLVDADLTSNQYKIIRAASKSIYPCYSLVQKEKNKCYPEDIFISEIMVEVKLQNLLDHTTRRICTYLEEVLMLANNLEVQNMELLCKWGCDGSQQQQFKQKFENSSDSDANIFLSSLVPLRLVSYLNGRQNIWWQNPVPSSPRFCRPIRMQFIHENNKVTQDEISYIENAAQNLEKTEVAIGTGVLQVKHTLMPTMVDGKVCNAATGTASTMRCYICKQSPKDFNNLKKVSSDALDPNSLKFGLSILHARIRFFESILHLSYKLPLKKWQARSKAEKKTVSERKKQIQDAFRQEMGLLVDVPKAGFGNSNDGNTSRRFFSDPETAGRITEIDIDFIKKLKIILEVLSSGYKIDLKKFSDFLEETAKLYVSLYQWHPMTPTLHKILSHGATVIEHALLPIGQLSEEAAEARNKHFRMYRQKFSRKFSRKECNEDVFKRLLLSSDPYISSSRNKSTKIRKAFSKEALEFLLQEDNFIRIDEENDDDKDDDDVDDDEDEE